ncbi:MAG: 23S rRNA pseudouridine(955/2504/2580) synthase RluC [Pseudomonadota bacterium]
MDDSSSGGSPKVRLLAVDVHDSGQRLDNFLNRELKGVPKARIYRALRKGEVRVNKGRVRADYRLVAGDMVRIPPLRRPGNDDSPVIPGYWPAELEQRVVYEDGDLLVIDKPSGLAVHGGSGLDYGLIECLRQMRPKQRYLELVHRLDRDTSGLILLAKRGSTLKELHRQLREKRVEKRYLLIVEGHWPKHCQLVDAPLEKNHLQSGERMVKVSGSGKRAMTEFSVIERLSGATLLEARPITGRTHQIRVHALHTGHPILGDRKYGSEKGEIVAREAGLQRLCLHASRLRFELPGGELLALDAPLEVSLEGVLKRLRA